MMKNADASRSRFDRLTTSAPRTGPRGGLMLSWPALTRPAAAHRSGSMGEAQMGATATACWAARAVLVVVCGYDNLEALPDGSLHLLHAV